MSLLFWLRINGLTKKKRFLSSEDLASRRTIPDLCSVATLETKDGSWAGVLRLMDDQTHIRPGMEIQTISISTGSTTVKEASCSYEEQIDRVGCWANDKGHFHFSSVASNKKQDGKSEYDPSRGKDRGPFFQLYGGLCQRETARRDAWEAQKLALRDPFVACFFKEEDPWTEKELERYEFHNILWVETRDGIMYRKAAGRVPKEIWEENCEEPEEIVLG